MERDLISTAEMGPVSCTSCGKDDLTLVCEEDDSHTFETIRCKCGHQVEMPSRKKPDRENSFVCLLTR